jgi:anaerobic dimethyl sulfoxide reductase subunit B
MAKQMAFYFDANACTGCKACQIACTDRSDLPLEVTWRRVFYYEGGGWLPHPEQKNLLTPSNVFAYAISAACMHCENPPCADVCPTLALTKDRDGVVTINESRCIGCRYCEWTCPYGGLHFNESKNVMTKCDFCQDLLAVGKNPVCVDACVTRCLQFGELDELRAKYGDVNSIAPLPNPDITKPSLVITPHKHAQMSDAGTGRIVELEEL